MTDTKFQTSNFLFDKSQTAFGEKVIYIVTRWDTYCKPDVLPRCAGGVGLTGSLMRSFSTLRFTVFATPATTFIHSSFSCLDSTAKMRVLPDSRVMVNVCGFESCKTCESQHATQEHDPQNP